MAGSGSVVGSGLKSMMVVVDGWMGSGNSRSGAGSVCPIDEAPVGVTDCTKYYIYIYLCILYLCMLYIYLCMIVCYIYIYDM